MITVKEPYLDNFMSRQRGLKPEKFSKKDFELEEESEDEDEEIGVNAGEEELGQNAIAIPNNTKVNLSGSMASRHD